MERRLAAIFAADMVGFSRLMEADEMGTLTRQKRYRTELIDPKIEQHGGKIIKLTGDGMIAEFPSVVEAVQCAVSIQREMKSQEADVPEERQIQYRVAVNLGDVIFDDEENEVYGDGVNIAARLEALAPAGGIVVSGTAYDHLKANIDVGYMDIGEQRVKNISTPVRVYQVVVDGEQSSAAVARQAAVVAPKRRYYFAAVAIMAILIMVGLAAWQFLPRSSEPALAADAPILAMPAGPKIVVLPFDNLSGDASQEYFVDGLVEDLTTRLAEHGYLFVIGRNSAFKYKGQSPDIRDVGRDLGVDYVVEGSIQRSDENIRINAQLLNAHDGVHVWAKTYDRELSAEGIFDIQDGLTASISETIGGSKGVVTQAMLNTAKSRRPEDLTSFECVLLAQRFWNTHDPSTHARSLECLKDTVKRDPAYADAWAYLASMYRAAFEQGLPSDPDPLDRGEEAAAVALELAPDDPGIHLVQAGLMSVKRQFEDARSSIREAIRLSPSRPWHLHFAAYRAVNLAMYETGWPIWQKAIRLDPNPPSWTYWTAVSYQHHVGNLEEAYRYALILKRETGGYWHWVAATEASLLAEMGRMEEAQEALSRVLAMRPDFASVARDELSVWWWHSPDYTERVMNNLYAAGLDRSQ